MIPGFPAHMLVNLLSVLIRLCEDITEASVKLIGKLACKLVTCSKKSTSSHYVFNRVHLMNYSVFCVIARRKVV